MKRESAFHVLCLAQTKEKNLSNQLKRWQICPRAPTAHLDKFSPVPRLVVQILYNRGITHPQEIEDFLAPPESRGGNDPFILKGMSQTVERLWQAIIAQEPIAIYGDYDVDGVTATALMMQLLTMLGARALPYIPNRFDEGYGLNNEALAELASQGIKLVLTVDCGIRSIKEVAYGNSLGLEMIITDHHSVGAKIPPALAVINPKQADCPYSFKEFSGVGLAYKLAQALLSPSKIQNPKSKIQNPNDFLDLVALGTVADLVPLHRENRQLVKHGLRLLNQSLRPGLLALMGSSGFSSEKGQSSAKNGQPPKITAGTIGFVIGPRLNAAGRLDSAWAAYNLLMAQNELQAIHLAAQLDSQNRERQRLTTETVALSRQAVLADEITSPLYLISHPDFNPGIVGLAASRIVEEFYRPALIAEQGAEQTKGSARSIPEFHITKALDECADLLIRYGGHAAAAGFTLFNQNMPALQERLQTIARRELNLEQLRPTIKIDGEVNLRAVTVSLVESIANLEPFGMGNPTPHFLTRHLKVKQSKAIGQDGSHLRLVLHDGRQDWSAIAFRQGHWAEKLSPSQSIDAVYALEFNDWNGQRSMQLNIKDLRWSETAIPINP